MKYREITARDVDALFEIRVATRENALSMRELENLGITPESVTHMLGDTHRGWLAETEGRPVGFAMGNRETGEMWVIAVLPEHEGTGVGGRLLGLVERWLASQGWKETWLTTDMDETLRAYGFYLSRGWKDREVKNGLRYMYKDLSLSS